MKVKLLYAYSIFKLEKRVNEFISNKKIKVLELQYSTSIFYLSVMVVYEEV
jgi:hypothetical protein